MNIEQNCQPEVAAERLPAAVEQAQRIARDANHHPAYPRTCLSCGARESLDGSVPCGH